MLPVTREVQNMPTLPITSVRDALPPIEVGQITFSVIEAKQAASSLVEVEQVTVPFRLICADLVIQIQQISLTVIQLKQISLTVIILES